MITPVIAWSYIKQSVSSVIFRCLINDTCLPESTESSCSSRDGCVPTSSWQGSQLPIWRLKVMYKMTVTLQCCAVLRFSPMWSDSSCIFAHPTATCYACCIANAVQTTAICGISVIHKVIKIYTARDPLVKHKSKLIAHVIDWLWDKLLWSARILDYYFG